MGKNFILNADNFGISEAHNKAVLKGYNDGFLTSASLCANGLSFSAAINDILPECPNLGIGVHLNISEGNSLTNCKLLTNKIGKFNKNYLQLLFYSFNNNHLEQIEQEFRAQIEGISSNTKIDHIDSYLHIHAIPNIFKIVCKLAEEYNIPYVRTHFEKFYFIPNKYKIYSINFVFNFIKNLLLQFFTLINRNEFKKHDLRTNKYLIGICYSNKMDSETIKQGLETIKKDCTVEAFVQPRCYRNKNINANTNSKEFDICVDKELKNEIIRMGYNIINHKRL